MVTDPLYNAARDKRIVGPEQVNIQQCMPSGRATYYLRATVIPYKPTYLKTPEFL
jgi:hypothetical protein